MLFVDDSDDDTPHVIEAARERGFGSLAISLLHRSGEQRTGGLGGAVLAGLERTAHQWVCVMDGDLQHPPEVVPRLLNAATSAQADLSSQVAMCRAVGTRASALFAPPFPGGRRCLQRRCFLTDYVESAIR